jgi:hypothetical protein
VGLVACALCGLPFTGQAETVTSENSLKAAFIFNFAKLVEWPEGVLKPRGEFCIGTLGRSPLDKELSVLKGMSVQGRTVTVHQYNSPKEAAKCQVLFISHSDPAKLAGILEALKEAPVLTVSDQDAFCSYGGMLSLVNERGKIVFEVNLQETQRSRLKPSSHLLRLARKVYGR